MSESPQQAIARIRDTVQAAENAGRLDGDVPSLVEIQRRLS